MITLLDEDDVQEIRYLYTYESLSQRQLCKMFKVGISTLRKVLTGKYKVSKFDRPIGEYEDAG